jgi:hypothetical protein
MNAATSDVALRRAILSRNLLDALKRALQGGKPTKAGVARRKETEAVRLACEASVGAADSDLEGAAGHQRLDVRSAQYAAREALTAATDLALDIRRKSLISLALPRGLEPLFSP